MDMAASIPLGTIAAVMISLALTFVFGPFTQLALGRVHGEDGGTSAYIGNEKIGVANRHVDCYGDTLPMAASARLGTLRYRAGAWPRYVIPSFDGAMLFTIGYRNAPQRDYLTIWDTRMGRLLRDIAIPFNTQVQGMWVLPNGRPFVAIKVSHDDYLLWDALEDTARLTQGNAGVVHDEVNYLWSLSPNAQLLASGELKEGPGPGEGKIQVRRFVPSTRVKELKTHWDAHFSGKCIFLGFRSDNLSLVGIFQKSNQVLKKPGVDAGVAHRGVLEDEKTEVLIWSAMDGRELTRFELPQGNCSSFALSPDGGSLYVGTRNARIFGYDLRNGNERVRISFPESLTRASTPGGISAISVTADGRTLVAIKQGAGVAGFGLQDGRPLFALTDRTAKRASTVAILPGDGRFALGGVDGSLLICEITSGKQSGPITGHYGCVNSVAVVRNDEAITSGRDGTICRWDLNTGREISQVFVEGASSLDGLRMSDNGRYLSGICVRGGEQVLDVIDTRTGKVAGSLRGQNTENMRIDFLTGNRPIAWLRDELLLVADGSEKLACYNPRGIRLQEFNIKAKRINVIDPTSEEGIIVVGGGLSSRPNEPSWVGLFSLRSGNLTQDWKCPSPICNAFLTANGQSVFLTNGPPVPETLGIGHAKEGAPTAILICNLDRGKMSDAFELPSGLKRRRHVECLAVARNGYQVAAAEADNTIAIYEMASGGIRRRLGGHRDRVEQMAFTPDGRRLVSVSDDVTGLVWDVTPPRAPNGTRNSREANWEKLLSSNASESFRALGELASDPAGTVEFLTVHLKSIPALSREKLSGIVKRMDSDSFSDREAASKELDAQGSVAVVWVREALKKVKSAEVRRRLEMFLEMQDQTRQKNESYILTGNQLRERRAIELLELIDSPEALTLLKQLSETGVSSVSKDAEAALSRLAKRK